MVLFLSHMNNNKNMALRDVDLHRMNRWECFVLSSKIKMKTEGSLIYVGRMWQEAAINSTVTATKL